jgi:ABC-type amino acid transport substrate-binding protein
MDAGMRFIGKTLLFTLLALLIVGGVALGAAWRFRAIFAPDPTSIARASLEAVRAQDRLTPFAARFVGVVTSEQHRFGFSAKKTLIMPGLVRYSLDLGRLKDRDLKWDAATKTLSVTLPPLDIEGPEVDLTATREYGEGGVLMALTNAEQTLDAANRKAGQAELLRQAHDALPMRLARDAARGAVERSFALPLKAAGLEAHVTAKFAGE